MQRSTWPLLIAVAVSSCGILGADEERVIGRVDTPLDEHVSVPDTVALGTPFTVTVLTSGGGCDRKDSTESTVEGRLAIIVPFDLRRLGRNCAGMQVLFEHTAEVAFTESGPAEVMIVARSMFGEGIEIRRGVWVQ